MEVQDTLREPPAAAKSMKKTVPLALSTTFALVRCQHVRASGGGGMFERKWALGLIDSVQLWISSLQIKAPASCRLPCEKTIWQHPTGLLSLPQSLEERCKSKQIANATARLLAVCSCECDWLCRPWQ
jgi:hypothetical protein